MANRHAWWLVVVVSLVGCVGVAPDDDRIGEAREAVCTSGTLASNPLGAAQVGQQVEWTVGASCNSTNPQFKILALPPNTGPGGWLTIQEWSSDPTFTWDTTGKALGRWSWQGWAREAGSTSFFETYGVEGFSLSLYPPCSSGALEFSSVSPGTQGTTVTLSGSASCGGSPEYRFWQYSPEHVWSLVQDYGPSADYTWATSAAELGTYRFQVDIRNAVGSPVPYETYANKSYSLIAAGCSLNESVSPPDAEVGKTLTISGDWQCGNQPEFAFFMRRPDNTWVSLVNYGAESSFVLPTVGMQPGSYAFEIWARNHESLNDYDAFGHVEYTLAPPAPCTAVALSGVPASPVVDHSSVELTAIPSNCGTPTYKYWVYTPDGVWMVVQDWSPNPDFSWDTASNPAGDYIFHVWARENGSTAFYESSASVSYLIQ